MPPNHALKNGEDCNFISCLFYTIEQTKPKTTEEWATHETQSQCVCSRGQAAVMLGSGMYGLRSAETHRAQPAVRSPRCSVMGRPPGTRRREGQREGQGGPSEEDDPVVAKGLFQ